MYREYFITTPLILAPVPFKYNGCIIHLRGAEERSFIEGSSAQTVDDGFDFILAIRDQAKVPGITVQLRGTSEQEKFPDDPRKIKSSDWIKWVFSKVPLDFIPLIELDSEQCEAIQKELDAYPNVW